MFAAHERAVIRSRIRAALALNRARAERVGTIPCGYRLAADGRHVEEHLGEQATVARVQKLRTEGHAPRSEKPWYVQVLAPVVTGWWIRRIQPAAVDLGTASPVAMVTSPVCWTS